MKKKFMYRTWMGYCPSELKAGLGAGLGTGGAGGASGTAQAAWARGRRVSGPTGAGLAGRAGARGVRGRRARAAGERHRRAAGRHVGRSRRAGHGRLGGLGMQLGQWAVHLVHSACFDPV